jgi:glycosyltransferase involved in cell wall biosynthesis
MAVVPSALFPEGVMPFERATVLLPTMNETRSLRQTVEILRATCDSEIAEFLLLVCDRTNSASRAVCSELEAELPGRVVIHSQQLPFLGGALREGFNRAQGSHVVMMASDLETDPGTVKSLIDQAKQHPEDIITASRWLSEGGFRGYNPVKWALNFAFQRMFSSLYGARLTDMTFGFRIFPTQLVQNIVWEELRHPFLFETLVKPLRLGVRVREVPSAWKARVEGESQQTFFRNFAYVRTGLKARFASREAISRS